MKFEAKQERVLQRRLCRLEGISLKKCFVESSPTTDEQSPYVVGILLFCLHQLKP